MIRNINPVNNLSFRGVYPIDAPDLTPEQNKKLAEKIQDATYRTGYGASPSELVKTIYDKDNIPLIATGDDGVGSVYRAANKGVFTNSMKKELGVNEETLCESLNYILSKGLKHEVEPYKPDEKRPE